MPPDADANDRVWEIAIVEQRIYYCVGVDEICESVSMTFVCLI